jgi:uncharacterized protein
LSFEAQKEPSAKIFQSGYFIFLMYNYCMSQSSLAARWKYTLARVLLFCLSCAVALAASSRLTKEMPKPWSQHVLVLIACMVTIGLTILFVRWEGLRLSDIGVIPGRQSISRIGIGFMIGLLLAIGHATLVMLFGHVKLVRSPTMGFSYFISGFLLYLFIACREELAFRGYPLRSLNYVLGAWKAQAIIFVVFSLEHVAGGMNWIQAFLGPGVGAILFGIAAIKTKGIALPIGLHTTWNFGQWSLGFKNEPGIWQSVIEKGYETQVEQVGFICYWVVMSLTILAFYCYYRNNAKAAPSS